MDDLRLRIQQLLQQLNERVFGKEHVIALSLLSAVAGESIFLLGPPGVAKSMVARRLKLAFRRGEAFEYLMSKSSKGEKGQYFTPRYVIDMCVKMLNPQVDETMIDTAAGSSGFPVHTIFHVWKQMQIAANKPVNHSRQRRKVMRRSNMYKIMFLPSTSMKKPFV